MSSKYVHPSEVITTSIQKLLQCTKQRSSKLHGTPPIPILHVAKTQ